MNPKIYHIIHMDNLASVITDGYLYSDAYMKQNSKNHNVIGMNAIKE